MLTILMGYAKASPILQETYVGWVESSRTHCSLAINIEDGLNP
jgi:hypothetical protein